MGIELITTLALAAFIGLMLIEVPIAFSLMLSGALGIVLTGQASVAFSTLSAAPFGATGKYDLLVLPMFLLLGAVVSNAGIAAKIFEAANRIVGWMPSGLAVATIFACTVFGGISGSSAADVATLGRISVGEMRRHGYSAKFAAGVVAAAGTVAILIPPSIPLVIFGILTGVPIGSLLLAGIIPGIFTSVAFAAFVMLRGHWEAKRNPSAAPTQSPAAPATAESGRRAWFDHPFIGLAYAGILFLVIVGGIYSGLFTATEAAAVGAFAAVLIAIPVARAQRASVIAALRASLQETAEMTSMTFALLIGTAVFTYFLTITQLPNNLASWLVAQDVSPKVLVIAYLVILIPLGMFLDGLSMMLLTVPILYPPLAKLGVNGIWLGILVVTMIEVGLITPPVGINVYVIAGLVDDLSLEEAFAGAAPFIVIQLLVTTVIFMFPQIVLILPQLAAGTG